MEKARLDLRNKKGLEELGTKVDLQQTRIYGNS